MSLMLKCHGCKEDLPREGACKDAVLICGNCRKKEKKFKAARKAMEDHMKAQHSW